MLEPVLRARAETVQHVLGESMCDFKIQTYAGTAWEKVNFKETWSPLQGPFSLAKEKQVRAPSTQQVDILAEATSISVKSEWPANTHACRLTNAS